MIYQFIPVIHSGAKERVQKIELKRKRTKDHRKIHQQFCKFPDDIGLMIQYRAEINDDIKRQVKGDRVETELQQDNR